MTYIFLHHVLGLTCEELLADFEGVDQRCDDALDGTKHAAHAQVNQHEEKHDGPEGRCREVGHGLCEGDEGQACTLHCLRRRRTGRRRTGKKKVLCKLVSNIHF